MFKIIGDNLYEFLGYFSFLGIIGIWPSIRVLIKSAVQDAINEIFPGKNKKSQSNVTGIISILYLTIYTLLVIVYLVHILLYKV